jgi:hypothetical protein
MGGNTKRDRKLKISSAYSERISRTYPDEYRDLLKGKKIREKDNS